MTEENKQAIKRKTGGVAKAAGVLMITMMLSRVLGFVRDIVITGSFSFGMETDAYYAAFTIPDLIYYALVGGALSSAFIPVFTSYLAKEQEEDGFIMANSILNLVSIAALGLIGLGLIFTPQLVRVLVQFTDESFELTVLLTRIMFAQSFFMCLAGISQGILQSYKEFVTPAMGAVVYNIVIIVVGFLLSRFLGIMGFSMGVVIGAFLNLAMQIVMMKKMGFSFRVMKIDLHHPGVKQFFALLLPVLLGLSVNELNLLVSQYLGSGLGEGILSSLKNAQRIMMLPVGIFAASIGLSIFPTMTEYMAKGEMEAYKRTLTMGLRTILFITIPATVGLMALSYPIVRAMYLQFAVTEQSIQVISTILIFYCFGIVGYSAQQILNRGFYAIQDTKSPVTINIFILLTNVALSFLLVKPFGYRGLAFAYSASGLLSMVVLAVFLRKKIGRFGMKTIAQSVVKTMLASLIMGITVWGVSNGLENALDTSMKIWQVIQVGVGICVGIVVFAGMAFVMKMEEANQVVRILKRKIRRA